MTRFLLSCAFASTALRAWAQVPASDVQIDQARQFSRPVSPLGLPIAPEPELSLPGTDGVADDAFGAQVMFKSQERHKPFSAFAEVSAFFTNNVALAKRATLDDEFLVISAGAQYMRPLRNDLRLEAGVRSAVYRYAEYRELDFQSVDLSAGAVWAPSALHGAEVSLRYLYTNLTTAEGQDEIYKSHAALLGIQKVVPFSRAHALFVGASAQWTWADPEEPGRDEYAGYAGYHIQASSQVGADLLYRYGYFVYRHDGGRRDHNHTLSLALRYTPVDWATISATSYFGINRSNRSELDYEVWNAGVALQFSLRF